MKDDIITIILQNSSTLSQPTSPPSSLSFLCSLLKSKLNQKQFPKLKGKFTQCYETSLRFSSVTADPRSGKYVYFSDPSSNLIKRYNVRKMEISIIAGIDRTKTQTKQQRKQRPESQKPTFQSRTLALETMLLHPIGVAIDSIGNVVIADFHSNSIYQLEIASNTISLLVGGTENKGSSDDNEELAKAKINTPIDVAIDSRDNIYFTDRDNFTVRKIERSTGKLRLVTSKATVPINAVGKLSRTTFNCPNGIFMGETDDDVYVVDRRAMKVFHLDLAKGTSSFVMEKSAVFTVNHPWSGCYAGGHIYITDIITSCVKQIDLATNEVTTLEDKNGATGQVFGIDVDYFNQCLWLTSERGLFMIT